MKKAGWRLLLLLTMVAGAAIAQMPRYDVEAHCTEIAGFGGTYSHSLFNGCLDREQQAYDALKSGWDALSAEIKVHCDEIAKFGGSGSYSLLQGCVKKEVSSVQQRKTFKY